MLYVQHERIKQCQLKKRRSAGMVQQNSDRLPLHKALTENFTDLASSDEMNHFHNQHGESAALLTLLS